MKALLEVFATLVLVQGAQLVDAAPVRSPLLGSWAVDVSRLPVPPQSRPKSVTFTFTEVEPGKWRSDVDIKSGDGSDRRMTSTCRLDSSPCAIEGDKMEADLAAAKLPEPSVMILALTKSGVPASTRIYAVAPDGRTMVETAVYFGTDGKPIMRTNYFSRVR